MADQPLSSTELLLLESWVADNPGSRQFLRLAQAYVERERDEEAAEVLERGLVMNPDLLQARWMLGRVLERIGDQGGAVRQLESAARQITRQAGLFSDLARLLRKQGRESEARKSLDIADALGARTPTEAPPVPLPQLEGPVAREAPEAMEAAEPQPEPPTPAAQPEPQAQEEEVEWAESPADETQPDSFEDDVWAEPEDALAAPPKEQPQPAPGRSRNSRLMDRLAGWERAASRRAARNDPG